MGTSRAAAWRAVTKGTGGLGAAAAGLLEAQGMRSVTLAAPDVLP